MRGLLSAFRRPRERRGDDADGLLAHGNVLVEQGRLLEAIDVLVQANRLRPDPALESRLVRLRRSAFAQLDRSPRAAPPSPAVEPAAVDAPPFLTPVELTPATLRDGILRHGSVWVRGLIPPALVARLRDAIDRSFDGYDDTVAGRATTETARWFDPLDHIKDPDFARDWRRQANAVLAADSPRALFELFEVMRAVGLDRLLHGFFGERPSLAAEKCTLFRVHAHEPRMRVADWHQDGAFLGDGIRTVNCWYALTRCGRDAPGMDIVPHRLDHLLPLGEEGCHFDWTVAPNTVARAFPGVQPWRPEFHEGDVLLFDELCVHRTAAEEDMPNLRYAIESWSFASSVYPDGRSTPLVI
ncbi:MAG: phytanoyl-CoA dioxygenase family protein [bacterium]